MELLDFSAINWLAVFVCILIGQVFLTLWFVMVFGDSWAKEYGAADKKQHAKEIPGYTYGVQILCTALMIIGMALMQNALSINTLQSGLLFGVLMAVFFSIATALPGYAFLKRWNAFLMAAGSQTLLILIVSTILAIWK